MEREKHFIIEENHNPASWRLSLVLFDNPLFKYWIVWGKYSRCFHGSTTSWLGFWEIENYRISFSNNVSLFVTSKFLSCSWKSLSSDSICKDKFSSHYVNKRHKEDNENNKANNYFSFQFPALRTKTPPRCSWMRRIKHSMRAHSDGMEALKNKSNIHFKVPRLTFQRQDEFTISYGYLHAPLLSLESVYE